jgi:hypothetical protein
MTKEITILEMLLFLIIMTLIFLGACHLTYKWENIKKWFKK